MRGLKAPMTAPQAAARGPESADHEKRQQCGSRDTGHLVERSGELQILDDRAIGEYQTEDVHGNGDQCGPAEERMQA